MNFILKQKNYHENDKRLFLNPDTHTYYIDGDCKNIISSSSLNYNYFPSFDSDKIINNIINSEKWNNDITYKYYKMSKTKIKELWKENGTTASNLGTKLHEKIELFYNDNEIPLYENEDDTDFELFLKFYQEHEDLQIYRTEWEYLPKI